MATFAGNLMRLRSEKGLTRHQLEMESGVTEAMIYRLEYGKNEPGLKTLVLLAQGLGVPVAELVEGINYDVW